MIETIIIFFSTLALLVLGAIYVIKIHLEHKKTNESMDKFTKLLNDSLMDKFYFNSNQPKEKYNNQICNVNRLCQNKAIYTIFFNNKFQMRSSCEKHANPCATYHNYKPFIKKDMLMFL